MVYCCRMIGKLFIPIPMPSAGYRYRVLCRKRSYNKNNLVGKLFLNMICAYVYVFNKNNALFCI